MQATTTPQAPPAPQAPTLPQAVLPVEAGGTQTFQLPRTKPELDALRSQREEMSNQLTNVTSRRNRLVNSLEDAPPGPGRAGLEMQITQLNRRILQLEADLETTGRLVTTAPTTAYVTPPVLGGLMTQETLGILSGLFTLFVLAPLAFAAARLMFRRARVPVQPPGSAESAARIERIEQAVDAIAIEVERISEGQRFTTRLLAESHGLPALGAAKPAAEPIAVPQFETAPLRREGR